MTTKCIQLDFLLDDSASYKNWEIQEYKKKTFKSIRGLFARHNEIKSDIADLKKLLSDMFNVQIEEKTGKVINFQSDAETVVQDYVHMARDFANTELQEYRLITDRSLRSLSFKYNENERMLLDMKKFLDEIVFTQVESFQIENSPQSNMEEVASR